VPTASGVQTRRRWPLSNEYLRLYARDLDEFSLAQSQYFACTLTVVPATTVEEPVAVSSKSLAHHNLAALSDAAGNWPRRGNAVLFAWRRARLWVQSAVLSTLRRKPGHLCSHGLLTLLHVVRRSLPCGPGLIEAELRYNQDLSNSVAP